MSTAQMGCWLVSGAAASAEVQSGARVAGSGSWQRGLRRGWWLVRMELEKDFHMEKARRDRVRFVRGQKYKHSKICNKLEGLIYHIVEHSSIESRVAQGIQAGVDEICGRCARQKTPALQERHAQPALHL